MHHFLLSQGLSKGPHPFARLGEGPANVWIKRSRVKKPRSDGRGRSINSIVLQQDGKILVGGEFKNLASGRAGVVRLNRNGTLDPAFTAGSGPGGAEEYVRHLLLQPDGRLLVAGSFTSFNSFARGSMVRLQAEPRIHFGLEPPEGARLATPLYNLNGQPLRIETSTDLRLWQLLRNVTNLDNPVILSESLVGDPSRFYRAVGRTNP